MAIDDHPITALRNRIHLEAVSDLPFLDLIVSAVSKWKHIPPPVMVALNGIKKASDLDSQHKAKLMLDTFGDEIVKTDGRVDVLSDQVKAIKEEFASGLLLDAVRKASVTRDNERVKRIGLILAHGLPAQTPSEADEIEEMMRIAMELSDLDVSYLAKLVALEGLIVRSRGRIERYSAHTTWEGSELSRGENPESKVYSAS
jgi:hypothetical protein